MAAGSAEVSAVCSQVMAVLTGSTIGRLSAGAWSARAWMSDEKSVAGRTG